jgi:hypothetical protein
VSALAWTERPLEERVAYNPAFLALLLREAADGYQEEAAEEFPVPLAFIVVPLVLHRPTREGLPGTVATSMPMWLQEHPLLRAGFASRVRDLGPAVREALLVALQTDVLLLSGAGLAPGTAPAQARRATNDTRAMFRRARFVGRWLGRAGDVATIYFLWGVKP